MFELYDTEGKKIAEAEDVVDLMSYLPDTPGTYTVMEVTPDNILIVPGVRKVVYPMWQVPTWQWGSV